MHTAGNNEARLIKWDRIMTLNERKLAISLANNISADEMKWNLLSDSVFNISLKKKTKQCRDLATVHYTVKIIIKLYMM